MLRMVRSYSWDRRGRLQYLLFRRSQRCFYAFDLLMLDGKDMRRERLIDRKQELRRLFSACATKIALKSVQNRCGIIDVRRFHGYRMDCLRECRRNF